MSTNPSHPSAGPEVKHLTPILIVDAVEPCIRFWTDLGFTVENQVPGPNGTLVFASAKKGDVEVMYQTRASVIADNPVVGGELDGHSIALFIAVANLDDVERAVAGAPVVKARHKTFYGSTEVYVREPGGNVVGFAQF
jgi:hypothetical protein